MKYYVTAEVRLRVEAATEAQARMLVEGELGCVEDMTGCDVVCITPDEEEPAEEAA